MWPGTVFAVMLSITFSGSGVSELVGDSLNAYEEVWVLPLNTPQPALEERLRPFPLIR